jgi:hypothetical protein
VAIAPAEAAVQAVDETAELTQKWAGADAAAAAEAADAAEVEEGNAEGRVAVAPEQNLCVTVASRIPEMLAESMALAGDDAPRKR